MKRAAREVLDDNFTVSEVAFFLRDIETWAAPRGPPRKKISEVAFFLRDIETVANFVTFFTKDKSEVAFFLRDIETRIRTEGILPENNIRGGILPLGY